MSTRNRLDLQKKDKRKKGIPVARHLHEGEPVSLMLITVFRDAT
jgi:hypothetical protein